MRMAAGNMGFDEAVAALSPNPVQMYIDPQERRRIERRTGPLENMESGPGQVSLSDADSRELQQALRDALQDWHRASHTAIQNFVRDQDHAPNYQALILAVMGAPLAILGVGLAGPVAIAHAVATTCIGALGAIPAADRMGGFRTQMQASYDRVFENRTNSLPATIHNWVLGLTPADGTDINALKRKLVRESFTHTTGLTVNGTQITRLVYAAVKAHWDTIEAARRAERARRQQDAGSGYETMDYCWVAREVIPSHWQDARVYILGGAPTWFRDLYGANGPRCAETLRSQPARKAALRSAFERLAAEGRAIAAGEPRDVVSSQDLATIAEALRQV